MTRQTAPRWFVPAVVLSFALALMAFGTIAAVAPVEVEPAQASAGMTIRFDAGPDARGRFRIDAEPGTTHELATVDVPPELIGSTCMAVADAVNNTSTHPGNNLVLSSGDTSATAFDVERAAGATTPFQGSITLGPTVTVTLVMGEDGTFSGAAWIATLNCRQPPTTTTSPPSSTTTVPDTTTSEPPSNPSTTTSLPPSPPTSESTTSTSQPVASPPSSTSIPHDCPPGSHSIGHGACAADVESGAPAVGGTV